MADDVDKMNLAFDRVLESFKLKNLKDSQRDALEKLVGGSRCVRYSTNGVGKIIDFSVRTDCLRHNKTVVKCEVDCTCDFSPCLSYARPSEVP